MWWKIAVLAWSPMVAYAAYWWFMDARGRRLGRAYQAELFARMDRGNQLTEAGNKAIQDNTSALQELSQKLDRVIRPGLSDLGEGGK